MLIQARRGRIGRGLDAVELAIIVQSGIDRGEIVFRRIKLDPIIIPGTILWQLAQNAWRPERAAANAEVDAVVLPRRGDLAKA